MSEKGFMPLSAQLGIPGSSYRIQLGKVNNKWATRLAKGTEILDSKVFHDLTEDEPPNANSIVGWVLQVLVIPNINPYQIAKSVGFIRQESIRRNQEAKTKPAISIKEAKEAKLEELPEDAKARLAVKKEVGWVKEDAPATPAKSSAEPSKKRALPKIPGADSQPKVTTAPVGEGKGVFCVECGTEVKYCPCCGKKLEV
ncbi:MAG: hypothetical protein GY870_00190 [archaeon]|nr:hypothetical protein [archaeon]